MSRQFAGNGIETFRVVVEMTHRSAKSTSIYGPFANAGAARRCITRESVYWRQSSESFIAHIEVAITAWTVFA